MSADRTTCKIGTILGGSELRDAVHVAVCPIEAGEWIRPGEHIGIGTDGKATAKNAMHTGIADPFLKETIKAGNRFYMFMYPQTITSLRHEWTHPAFEPTSDEKKASESLLRQFCEAYEIGYAELLKSASEPNGYINLGFDAGNISDISRRHPEYKDFWDHIEIVTGRKFDELHRERANWTCGC